MNKKSLAKTKRGGEIGKRKRERTFKEEAVTTGEFKQVNALEDGMSNAGILELRRKSPKPEKRIYLSGGKEEARNYVKTGLVTLYTDEDLPSALNRYPKEKRRLARHFNIKPKMIKPPKPKKHRGRRSRIIRG